jgi:hypothetical protein
LLGLIIQTLIILSFLKLKTAFLSREDKIIKALERYKDKYNNDEEFRIKRKEYMRQYQQKKREERKNTPPENS